jgi:hypothetical protein
MRNLKSQIGIDFIISLKNSGDLICFSKCYSRKNNFLDTFENVNHSKKYRNLTLKLVDLKKFQKNPGF